MTDITSIPAPRIPFIDGRTGLISREWYRFLLNLFNLTGSGTNLASITDLQVVPPQQLDLFTAELQKHIDELELRAPPQPALLAQLQDVQVHGAADLELLQYYAAGGYWRKVLNLLVGGTLGVTGATTLSSTLGVTGVTTLNDVLVVPKTSGTGIKVDTVAPTFGWRDITSSIEVRGSGANDPSFAVYTGTALRAYSFSASSMKEVFFTFHMPHDYVPGTDIYFHAHWSNAAATPDTGNVVWGFEYTFAKGFGQQAFPATTTITVTAACPATRYMHNISETTAVTIAGLEVDGMILIRGYRDAANAADTCTNAVFLHTMDIHYQSTGVATKNKAPNFYA